MVVVEIMFLPEGDIPKFRVCKLSVTECGTHTSFITVSFTSLTVLMRKQEQ